MFRSVLLVFALLGCGREDKNIIDVEDAAVVTDADGDGFEAGEDCNDFDASINPGVGELCDNLDNNCDGQIDEGVTSVFYLDADGDGFGDSNASQESCEISERYVSNGNDCDDTDAEVYPSAPELCDEIDNDCNGLVDDDLNTLWYADTDFDGYGDPEAPVEGCLPGVGFSENNLDCDDTEYLANPSQEEICDGIDNDCNDVIDDDVAQVYYEDTDGDGFGNPDASLLSCTFPEGYAIDNTDCDDTTDSANPNRIELCDGIDNNCDGVVDEDSATDASTWYQDGDGDGYGDLESPMKSCNQPLGYTANDTDCDDGDDDINESADELCDAQDNNCDGVIDEDTAIDTQTWYQDGDGDGYGDLNTTTQSCEQPTGYVADFSDCDDGDDDINESADELCDAQDNNCDGVIDEDTATDAPTWYLDADEDGYGNILLFVVQCDEPNGYISDSTDCDDSVESTNPASAEVCDEVDNNCDGQIDEGVQLTFYPDADFDGFGDSSSPVEACSAPISHVSDDTDCDDSNTNINPDGVEICNALDDNCDLDVDEDFQTAGVYDLLDNCGSCGNDCSQQGFENAQPFCDASLTMPVCDFVCDSGFADANLDASDGCECTFISSVDDPFDVIDANCDGADGDHNDAIHVSITNGDPANDGSLGSPLSTIHDGLDLAVSEGKEYVLVAEGTYSENITLPDGVILYGSMAESFDERNTETPTTSIIGSGSAPAVIASSITIGSQIDGFYIEGNSGSSSGDSSIALFIEDSTDVLLITNNLIHAGDAQDGSDGGAGSDGAVGELGEDGSTGGFGLLDCSTVFDAGLGGEGTCGAQDVSGGDGAENTCPSYNYSSPTLQPSGEDGFGTDPGTGGTGGCDGTLNNTSAGCICYYGRSYCYGSGNIGLDGGAGSDGSGGSGSQSTGYLSGMTWVVADGSDGDDATNGSGGGGGGTGSGAEKNTCSSRHHIGGTGGGGGAGGCGGDGGVGGLSGGSSFGVMYSCTATCTNLPIFVNNGISSGDGGAGGDGG
ncbi:MAG: MopE-related protein, partial [Myxococcota bacterium]|nr:MopE-related protein [Myxococcota bacterium]